MRRNPSFARFLRLHPVALVLGAAGLVMLGLGYAQQLMGFPLGGLDAPRLQAAGVVLLVISIVGISSRWSAAARRQGSNALPAAKPGPDRSRR